MNTIAEGLDKLQQTYPDHSRDSLARAAWSVAIEPGDQAAGLLISETSPEEALRSMRDDTEQATSPEVQALRDRVAPRLTFGAVEVALRAAARFGAQFITPEHEHWPTRLSDLGVSAPVALWVRGNSELLVGEKTIAIVGARAATGYGEHVTMELSAGLVDRGFTVASGAAYGIDGMAHRAALASHGRTIAYLAGGVDRFYPSGHDALLTRIVEAGAVVSEMPCGSVPTRWRFLQRNRLIAANSKATLVVEAGWRSGSLNVAGHANSLGRPLGAVPGPVTSAASAGCHRLIREFGATCVTTAEEAADL